jgi:hypothetical protein
VKRFYARTSKNGHIAQMTKHERRERYLLRNRHLSRHTTAHSHHVPFWDTDPLPYTDPMMHHAMSESKKHPQDVLSFRTLFPKDPATKVRLYRLVQTSLIVNIVLHIRISFQSLKITCSDGSLIENLTAMTSPFLQPSGTQSV